MQCCSWLHPSICLYFDDASQVITMMSMMSTMMVSDITLGTGWDITGLKSWQRYYHCRQQSQHLISYWGDMCQMFSQNSQSHFSSPSQCFLITQELRKLRSSKHFSALTHFYLGSHGNPQLPSPECLCSSNYFIIDLENAPVTTNVFTASIWELHNF